MAKRVFTEEERVEYREKMLDAGFDLLKQYGMTHMSVAKITEAAGIGVSTFYNFFSSKEEYVYEEKKDSGADPDCIKWQGKGWSGRDAHVSEDDD